MEHSVSRRDVLRAFAAAVPLVRSRSASRRRIGIVGGGMAGVSLAWMLDGAYDVVLFEARPSVGGNVQTIDVQIDGLTVPVDIGAQYFHPGPYPVYSALLAHLGLYPPVSGESRSFPASITVSDPSQAVPRFVSPVLPDRSWPLFASWNTAGLQAFGAAFAAAKLREQFNASWTLTLEDWLPTLGLSREQWEGMLLPWAASLFSGSLEQARGLSARAAMIFAAKALPPNVLDPVVYYVLNHGMAEPLRRMVDQLSTVEIRIDTPVQLVSRDLLGGLQIHSAGGVVFVDDVVFASSGPGTLQLLGGLPGTSLQRSALQGIEFHDARLALHTDPIYAASHPALWSFLNCEVRDASCEASMWLANVVDAPPATAAKLWKSWVTHREPPSEVLHVAEFKHMLPTPATLLAQSVLRGLQGFGRIWFAGGHTLPYDSQETALLSALSVAVGLGITSARTSVLVAREREGAV
jgi:predicted NAD/FAD-binding protein